MPTPRKKYPYNVYYKDGTYLTYDFTRADVSAIESATMEGKPWVKLSVGLFKISDDIRSIVELKEEKAEAPKSANPEYVDMEVQEYLRAARERDADDDLDYH